MQKTHKEKYLQTQGRAWKLVARLWRDIDDSIKDIKTKNSKKRKTQTISRRWWCKESRLAKARKFTHHK